MPVIPDQSENNSNIVIILHNELETAEVRKVREFAIIVESAIYVLQTDTSLIHRITLVTVFKHFTKVKFEVLEYKYPEHVIC